MKFRYVLVLTLVGALILGCSGAGSLDEKAIEREVRSVLLASVNAWNEGDVRNYMECYYKSDSLRFAGGDWASYGWQALLERYQNAYPDKAAMGHLTFSDVDIDVVCSDVAIVFGHWKLDREAGVRSGLYTLVFYNTADGWRIVHDHSSSAVDS
jgi:ketosteroid isomerase-like protein